MARTENHRETGARKYPAASGAQPQDEFSQDAAGNTPPSRGVGLTQPLNETSEVTRQSDGTNPPTRPKPSSSVQKNAGAGPAISEHSKDAKAPRAGRQPGAYIKDR